MAIHVLPAEIASQIAAGEVVERPGSVVKELLENALDAGARVISIEIREAGRTLIRVSDDGAGIAADELSLAVERHATSKLTTAEELFKITTLGFRGEALASIGSVSRMTVISRTPEAAAGARLKVEGGSVGKVEKAGVPVGTVIQVEDLFYNVPARLKFLKTDMTERKVIHTLVTRYALAYPHVRMEMIEEGTTSLQTTGDGERKAILSALYGVDTARQMLEVIAEEDGLKLTGFISPVTVTRSNRKELTFFINGRWVQDTPLSAALLQAYHTLLMVGRYPLAALFLTIPAGDVDVNVHPAKAEVRFREPDKIFSFVQRSTRRALLAFTPVPQAAPQILWGRIPAGQDNDRVPDLQTTWEPRRDLENQGSVSSGTDVTSTTRVPLLRLIGQIGASYLVAEGPDGLYLIDQHAAHERILFEKLMAQRELKNIPSQALLTPPVVELSQTASDTLTRQLDGLEALGFTVEAFGPNAFRVLAVPTLFTRSDPGAALLSLVEDFEEDETPLAGELEKRIAGRVCKRLAIRAGQILSGEEQRALVNDLEACASPRTCPHGRPTMIHLSVDVLERQFGRRGAR